MSTVIEETVQNTICCGCGVCAALCPSHCLEMQWNVDGEYNPVKISNCKTECGICLSVCPFAENNPNEDKIGKLLYGNLENISHTPETGFYLNVGVGFVTSEEARLHSVSGGLTTWLLQKLLEKNVVDTVICVTATNNPDRLFKFTIAKTKEEIYAAAGSAYYPVEMSEVLSYMIQNPGNYALVGVPCFLKAVRLAQEKNKVLRERLKVCVGLVCGLIPNKHLVTYMGHTVGISDPITQVNFREKREDKNAGTYSTSMSSVASGTLSTTWDKNQISYARQLFGLHSCDCCDDVFAELADVTFMDAWLPEYSSDWRGTSIYLTRSPIVENIIHEGIQQTELTITPITISDVILSQKPRLDRKRGAILSYKIECMREVGYNIPQKRSTHHPAKLSAFEKYKQKRILTQKYECRKEFGSHNYTPDLMEEWFEKESQLPLSIRFITLPLRAMKFGTSLLRRWIHL